MSTHSLHSLDYESPSSYEEAFVDDDDDDDDDNDVEGIASLNDPLTKENPVHPLVEPNYPKTRLIPDQTMTSFSDGDETRFYGLGYEFSTDDYKMVRASCCISSKSISFEVFNLKTGYWKTGQAFNIDIDNNPDEIGIFYNGSLNWLVRRRDGYNKREKVLSFDMKDEIFIEILLPECGGFSSLGDKKGCLYAVCGGDGAHVEIWVMKEYGVESSWTKVLKWNFVKVYCDYEMWPVCFTRDDDVIVDIDSWTIARYSLSSKTVKKFKKRSTDWHYWIVYHQTLVSP
ncbi:F-box protein CPR1-like [Rutidosis leptorrhynchoides]|uniref:F-box protein CPR1-like n=1 Tax=Rutidosis leptorrhynchoides TaxID=125765 RepID=UPI003A98E981